MLGGKFRENLGRFGHLVFFFLSYVLMTKMAMHFPYIETKKPTNKKEPKINIDKKNPCVFKKNSAQKEVTKRTPKEQTSAMFGLRFGEIS